MTTVINTNIPCPLCVGAEQNLNDVESFAWGAAVIASCPLDDALSATSSLCCPAHKPKFVASLLKVRAFVGKLKQQNASKPRRNIVCESLNVPDTSPAEEEGSEQLN